MLVNMKEILETAEKNQYAIGCINTPNVETIRAVIGAAEELNTPVIIDHAQVHDSLIPIERTGPEMIAYAKKAKVPVCVHLDHGSDYNFVMRAIRVGFPSIMYDCSELPYEENLKNVKEFTKIAHNLGITVEAELGIMASSEEDSHGGKALTNEEIRKYFTDPKQAAEFAEKTGCDALAVCFGTMHGIYAEPPKLDITRVTEIRAALPKSCRVVMHGASGVEFSEVQNAINAGCSKINYYSYMAKATTKFVMEKTAETNGKIPYHELQEATFEFMKDYAKNVIKAFKNGK
ncbi:D-tagatose-1,6-bisphosphate aldolase subunit GatY [Sebaldella termitidis]|uniref:Tagatose-bisphosphate aldolase n=1 Tax=Sebaldella termitidis (strain ATCC 33386 / NCTC 11300) TaxID=526218 RepID=D1AIC4_SEBTE|nr:class II fructose-bisphosphate aldolase [Sebaldella termitidis]ACZ08508.1 Tagatose-bisphosphate aldolase [Sebaldella termitidis ATCC 33386]SUI23822.1 D-tagatose-1,6-bisphosphate aldolase subunit GatY [Sebaldella termitidis]